MKFATLSAIALAVTSVYAIPAAKRDAPAIDDTTILNYALTLEHLESAFYSGALAKFDQHAFLKAGLPAFARGRFEEIAAHEKAHVAFLSAALGDAATQPCEYSFPYTDPKSFAALSQVLEGVGVSAYAGAAQYITNKAYLTAAASVLATEARHASWVAAAVNKFAGWSGALDVPLDFNQVYTLAASFITSCPSSNPTLPVKAFPALTFSAHTNPGSTAHLTFEAPGGSPPLFVAFFTGLGQVYAPIKAGNKVTVPTSLEGTVYAVVTSNGTTVSDATIVAGPAILELEYNSAGKLIKN